MSAADPSMPSSLPHVLFDIDGTLTDDARAPQIDSRYVMGNALFELFTDHMVKQGRNREEASQELHAYAEEVRYWDYDNFVRRFELPEPQIWEELTRWHLENIHVYADGVNLVHRLYSRGIPLYIVSNNPRLGCLLKLETAGLGSLAGSFWFRDIFCSNHQYGQKFSPEFWQRILNTSGLDPSETVIVGNNLHEDYEVPSGLGFRGSYIVDRKGLYNPGAAEPVFVTSLLEVETHLLSRSLTTSTP